MGYSGLGMQRWISTLKPREFLGKRSKPDGGGVNSTHKRTAQDFYHFEPAKMKTSRKRIYTKAYKSKLNAELQVENKRQSILAITGVTIISILITLFIFYLNYEFNLF